MPYEPVTWLLPPNPDGTMRLVSVTPRKDRPGADLQWWDLSDSSIKEPCRLLELPFEVMSNILHQVSFLSARVGIFIYQKLILWWQIEDKADLYALLRAAPKLYNVIVPVWWKHLTINLRNDRYRHSVPTDLQHLLKARSPDLDRLQFVKSIVVEGTSPPLNWCVHRNRIYGKFFTNQSNNIAMFLRQLKPNSLKHFR